jgi:hypothetical protein
MEGGRLEVPGGLVSTLFVAAPAPVRFLVRWGSSKDSSAENRRPSQQMALEARFTRPVIQRPVWPPGGMLRWFRLLLLRDGE